jgi:lysophospholipase L1-like esterase
MPPDRLSLTQSLPYLALKLTEYDDDTKWPRRPGYSQMSPINGTMLNGTYLPHSPIIAIGNGYKRPGFEPPLARGIPLRIMALGASTTRGEKSTDNNGFRQYLRDRLVAIGNPVNYVGTSRIGEMADNDVDAWPGTRLDAIRDNVVRDAPGMRPNLYLANVGTNDCLQHIEIPDFYKKYYQFLNEMLAASPRATIILATLLPTTETERFNGAEDVAKVNIQIRLLAKILHKEGKPVVLAEMQGTTGIQESNLGPDGMHPTDAGYHMMGRIIFDAILQADARGFLRPAEPVPGIDIDGDAERRDNAYDRWRAKKTKEEQDAKYKEEQEIRKMEDGIAKHMKEVEKTKESRMSLRGHANLARGVIMD